MRQKILTALAFWGCAFGLASGQDPTPAPATAAEIQELRQQVQALTEMVKTLQQQVQDQQAASVAAPSPLPQNPEPPELAGAAASATPSASAPPLFPTTDSSVVASSSASAAPGAAVNANGTAFPTSDAAVTTTAEPSAVGSALTQPIPIFGGGGKTYMNISFDGVFALAASTAADLDHIEVGDHDPQQRGFNARNAEIALDGAVDPYFEGFANIVLKLDNDNETEIELEEAFMQTTSLPFGLQLKGGQFFAAFGRLNPTHPHTWDFADDPLVNGRLLGPDGLRGVGLQLSWTLPVPWYSQLIGADAKRPRRHRLFVPESGRERHFLLSRND